MVLLLAGIVVLSLADLAVALAHLRTHGLLEANPIAALLIKSTGSAMVLSAYKLATVGICVGLLYHLRRRVEGEAAAWCAIVILAALSLQWFQYTRQFDDMGRMGPVRTTQEERWLTLD